MLLVRRYLLPLQHAVRKCNAMDASLIKDRDRKSDAIRRHEIWLMDRKQCSNSDRDADLRYIIVLSNIRYSCNAIELSATLYEATFHGVFHEYFTFNLMELIAYINEWIMRALKSVILRCLKLFCCGRSGGVRESHVFVVVAICTLLKSTASACQSPGTN